MNIKGNGNNENGKTEENNNKMSNFSKIVKKFDINQYTRIYSILPNLIAQNHSYEDFILIMRLCVNKINKQDKCHYYYDSLKDILKDYSNKYYTNYSLDNVVKLVEFLKLYKEGMNYDTDIYLCNNLIIDALLDKLTPFDVEYLINQKMIDYYSGKRKIPQAIFDVFYSHHHEIIHHNTNAFIMKGYTVEQMDELITVSLKSGVPSPYIWNFISDRILTLKTPYWFWDKHKTSIIWHFVTENIINLLDEKDSDQLKLFLKWMQDFYIFIDNSLGLIPKNLCLPEIMIATFYNSPNLNLVHILKFQQLSIKLLNFLAEQDILINCHWEFISTFQILDPDFIKKYENKLDWKLLNFNPTWKYFPYDNFHRRLEMNIQNVLLWGTIENKIKVFHAMGLDLNKCYYQNSHKKNKHVIGKTLDKDNTLVQLYVHFNESRFGLDKGKPSYSSLYNNNTINYDLTYHDMVCFINRYSYVSTNEFAPVRNQLPTKYISINNADKIVSTYREVTYYNPINRTDIHLHDNLEGPPVFSCLIDVNKSIHENEEDDYPSHTLPSLKVKKITININDILCYHTSVKLKNHGKKKGDAVFIPILLPFNYYYQIQ
jgi:hypothetical protein